MKNTSLWLLGVFLFARTSVAAAQSPVPLVPELRLEWRAEPTCASGEAVERDVERLLEGAPGKRRSVAARVRVEPSLSGAWHVEVLTTTAEGASRPRAFDAETCDAAKDAVALVLAIAVNPQLSVAVASAPASPAPAPAPEPPKADAPTAAEPRAPRESAAAPVSEAPIRADSLWLSAAAAGDVGSLPRSGLGAELVLAWQRRHVWLELSGAYWVGQSATALASETGADFRLLSLRARGAYGWKLRAIELGPFLGLGLERFSAAGFGGAVASFDRSATVPVLAAGGVVAWRPAGPLLLRLAVEGLLLGARPEFVVLNDAAAPSPVHQPERVVARASVGAGFCFF